MKVLLNDILKEYSEKNFSNKYNPVAVGKYGIRKRSDIYKKELANDYSKNKIIRKNTLVIGMGSTQIDIGILSEDEIYSVSPAYHTFKINSDIVDSKYLDLLFLAKNNEYTQKYMVASARQGKSVNLKDMLKEYVEIPDFEIQHKVIEKIDEIKKFLSQEDTNIAYYEELIKSRFIEMFGDPVYNPKQYPLFNLEDLGFLKRGTSKHRPRNAPELLNGPYPLIQTGDVSNSDTYITKYNSTYSELGLKQSKLWDKGTLCITIAANIAETAILSFDACFPDSVVGFIPNNKVTTLFIHNWFKFLQPILEENAPAVAQKNLNVETLGKTQVIVPPIELQNEFAEFVKLTDKLKFIAQKRIDLYTELLNKKMDEYFN